MGFVCVINGNPFVALGGLFMKPNSSPKTFVTFTPNQASISLKKRASLAIRGAPFIYFFEIDGFWKLGVTKFSHFTQIEDFRENWINGKYLEKFYKD